MTIIDKIKQIKQIRVEQEKLKYLQNKLDLVYEISKTNNVSVDWLKKHILNIQ